MPQAFEIGKRCAEHPYFECDLDYEMMYRFFNFIFEGNCTFYTTEKTFNAGYWCELPEGKTTRAEELNKCLDLIKEKYDDAECGMFFTRNIVGDLTKTIFSGQFFTLDICYEWAYFEMFGCTEVERNTVECVYKTLGKVVEEM